MTGAARSGVCGDAGRHVMTHLCRSFVSAAVLVVSGLAVPEAWAEPFRSGDVFPSVNDGMVQHYDGRGQGIAPIKAQS